jgi:hypothetical protein
MGLPWVGSAVQQAILRVIDGGVEHAVQVLEEGMLVRVGHKDSSNKDQKGVGA